jgi:ABC-type transport system substrate-binding protein
MINKYVAAIPLWSGAAVNGYRKGWDGVVNHEGYGITYGTGGVYYWSLFNMRPTPGGPYDGDDTVTLGFKSDPIEFNVATSEWVWDWIVLDAMYETLVVRNPYNLADVRGMLAESYTTETWDTDKIAVTYTLKPNIKWHDGTILTPEDVQWGLNFIKDCGPGVAWNIFQVRDIDHIDTKAEDPTLGDRDVKLYYTTGSYWAATMAGFCEFPSRKVWMAASEAIGFGYDPDTHTFDDVTKVREYHPWEMDVYDATTGGVGSDGIVDLAQDGTGPWIFVGADELLQEYCDLRANREYHMSQDEVSAYLSDSFWRVGDTNRDSAVNIGDMQVIARSLGTDNTWPIGTDWDQFNPDADLNEDGKVDATDIGMTGRSYGRTAG